jgi:ABC-type sugar transport system ATPase subunit
MKPTRQCELQFDAGRGTTMRLSQKPVALARAFLAYALVLILDEATSSLDSESEALIRQAMERLMKGRTAITIAFWFSIAARSSSRVPTPRLSRAGGTFAACSSARRRSSLMPLRLNSRST